MASANKVLGENGKFSKTRAASQMAGRVACVKAGQGLKAPPPSGMPLVGHCRPLRICSIRRAYTLGASPQPGRLDSRAAVAAAPGELDRRRHAASSRSRQGLHLPDQIAEGVTSALPQAQ